MTLTRTTFEVGAKRVEVVCRDLTRTQITQYAGASGDYNPLHTDDNYAVNVKGFRSVFAHGMLTAGLTARVVTDWVGDGRLTRYGVRFAKQVWPGDTLTVTATVTAVRAEPDGGDLVELRIVTRNQDDVEVLTGYASARVEQATS